jgi:hypothetical protein
MKKQSLRISRIARPLKLVCGVLVLLGALMTVSPAQAEVSCHVINAKGVGQDTGGGNTTANIIGGGLLHGTNAAHVTITGVSGTVASFVETATFTNQHGTLTVLVTGGIDFTTGQFSASGPVTAATGGLSGATGNISFSGVVSLSSGVFTEDISGALCVDLAP